ncbi:T9SS type A sorting domain-containing protein [bacterium]|nr:T9SS type A sorting domain-containing protein [bacterium]
MKILKTLFVTFAAVILLAGLGASKAHAWCDPGDIYCGTVIDTTVRFGHDDVERYRSGSSGPYCTPGGTDDRWRGKAHVYRIRGNYDPLWITLDWNDNPTTTRDDLILVLLEDCDANKCMGADPHYLEFSTQNGNRLPNDDSNGFWIIVDSRRDTTIAYTLRIFCGDYPFDVELISFSATRSAEGVDLRWSTASETENDRFEITRRELGTDDNVLVGVVAGHGTTSSQQNYQFVDRSAGEVGYEYQLAAFDVNGNMQVFGHAIVESGTHVTPVADEFKLIDNYPNPFNPTTNIRFSLASASEVALSVYDVQGRLVAELFSGSMNAGAHELAFDATGLTSGVYFAQLSGSFGSDVMKMVLMR